MNTSTARAERDPPRPFPLPSDLPADRLLVRAVCAYVAAASRGGAYPLEIAKRAWPRDLATHALIERAATTPGTTTGSGWADTLAAQATGAFLASLQPSAGASLIQAGVRFSLAGRIKVNLPRAQSTGTARWVPEGAPIPVGQASLVSVPLGPPTKLALIESLTREVAEHAAEDGQSVVEMILRDAVRLALDASLFSNAAAGSAGSNPAGLLNGVAATTASTATDGFAAALADARALTDAVVAGGGGSRVMFFASPGRAMTLKAYLPDVEAFGSSSIPGTQLIAIDAAAFASGFDSVPEISASLDTAIHFEDTAPAQIGTVGTPNVVAAPTRSAFQQDIIVLKVILRAAWAMRLGAIAHIDASMLW